jgi:hypothetical protein
MSITVETIYDGKVLRPLTPVDLIPNTHYSDTIDVPEVAGAGDAWAIFESLSGSYDGPSDWSTQHDHYICGLQKTPDSQL